VRFRLLPADEGFFDLFNAAASNVVECGRRLRELLDQSGFGGDATIDAVIDCERRGDEVTRDIMRRLNTSFVTPFDREDIHALAEELDDVVDDMLEVAHRLDLGDRDVASMPELKQQADVLVLMADEVAKMVVGLRSMQGLRPHLDAVDRLESEGDVIYRQALRRLYSDEFKARATLYWKDVVEAMERALDTMEDISDVVEAIALKHA
jgi:predicted phosphate transport protein (TIGR00153 family)